MKRIAFIINPISGTKHKEIVVSYLRTLFSEANGYDALYYYTKHGGDAFDAAERFKNDKYDIVVAVGGDGTVNEVAKGLVGSDTKFGIIPVGSGNGLARHLKIPMSYTKAAEVILEENVQMIDAGKINDRLFFCTAGLGFEAVIGEKFNSSPTRGMITYVHFCAKEYVTYKRESYDIEIAGNRYNYKAFLITFANGSQWGNNVFIAPDANISDGMVDVVIWKRAPLVTMPVLAAGLFLKKIMYSEYVDTFRCKEIHIRRQADGLVQFDGESCSMGAEINVSVLPHAVKAIVPSARELLASYSQPVLTDILPKLTPLFKQPEKS